MEHLALYREWRPQFFRDVVGQEHVTRTLKNAVRQGRIAHAYLFCGPRGTGKTSTARILAKAANCPQSEEGEPCNRCALCLSITAGTALDVLEMDAASHRGIEEIRDLRQRVGFAPTAGRFKFYIIDEVHMLTGEAFNALLKTLEEPPRYAVFVLATTEAHKVPPTIASRCQRFDFRRLGREAINGHLARVAREKGWEVEPDALSLLSRQAGGALRDALGLLDQAASFTGGRITRADVEALTGALGEEPLKALISAVTSGDVPALLNRLESLFAAGYEPRQVLFQLADYLRDLLFASGSLAPEGENYAAALRALAAAEAEMKGSSRPDLILELALLRLAGEGFPASAGARPLRGAPGRLQEETAPQEPRAGRAARQPGPEPPDPGGGAPAGRVAEDLPACGARAGRQAGAPGRSRGQAPGRREEREALRNVLCNRLSRQPLLAQVLAGCKFERRESKIVVVPPSPFARELLQKEENRRLLLEAIRELEGDVELEFAEKEPRQLEMQQSRHTGAPDVGEKEGDPGGDPVGMALSLFKGEIISQAGMEGE